MPHSPKHNVFQIAIRLFWRSIVRCFEDNTPMIAAAVSFYTILSLTPESARDRVLQWSSGAMGIQAANFVKMAIDRAEEATPLATAIGIIWLISSATLAFDSLYDGLNLIWRAKPPAGRGLIRTFVVKRGFAFLLVLFLGGLVLASLLISTILGTIAEVVPRPGGVHDRSVGSRHRSDRSQGPGPESHRRGRASRRLSLRNGT